MQISRFLWPKLTEILKVKKFWDTLYQKIFIAEIKNPTKNNPACQISGWYLERWRSYRPSNTATVWLHVPFRLGDPTHKNLNGSSMYSLFPHVTCRVTGVCFPCVSCEFYTIAMCFKKTYKVSQNNEKWHFHWFEHRVTGLCFLCVFG